MSVNRWGGHPVFAPALDAIANEDENLPEQVDQRLRGGRLNTGALLRVATVCVDALHTHATKGVASELQRFARLMERQRSEPLEKPHTLDLPPWARTLSHAESHLRRIRGMERLAVLNNIVAWCDIRSDGRAAVRFTTELVEGSVAVLVRKKVPLENFVCALLDAP